MRSRKSVLGVWTVAVAVFLGTQLGCSSTQEMRSGYGVPASEGTVDATDGGNGNTDLEVRVKHLAQPWLVASDATVYVVWVQAPDATRQNVGALTLNDNLEGSLKTVTPHRQFMLSVTPEASGEVDQPRHQPVFTAKVDRSK